MGHQPFWYNVMQLQGHSLGTRGHKEEVAQHDPPFLLLTLLCHILRIQAYFELYKSRMSWVSVYLLYIHMCIDNYYSYVYNTVCMCSTIQSYFSIYTMSFMQNSTYPLYHDVSMTRLLHLAIYTSIHWSPDYDHLRQLRLMVIQNNSKLCCIQTSNIAFTHPI